MSRTYRLFGKVEKNKKDNRDGISLVVLKILVWTAFGYFIPIVYPDSQGQPFQYGAGALGIALVDAGANHKWDIPILQGRLGLLVMFGLLLYIMEA